MGKIYLERMHQCAHSIRDKYLIFHVRWVTIITLNTAEIVIQVHPIFLCQLQKSSC